MIRNFLRRDLGRDDRAFSSFRPCMMMDNPRPMSCVSRWRFPRGAAGLAAEAAVTVAAAIALEAFVAAEAASAAVAKWQQRRFC